jgi:energy-converting hydrogenase Eha subunit H
MERDGTSRAMKQGIKKIPTLNEYNVISLIDNFVLINEIFTSETSMKNEIDKKLEEKLKKIEKQKIEVKIRNDRLKHQLALKQEKVKKNQKKLVRRI